MLDGYCISCWCELEPSLARLGSTKCHDCRDGVVAGGPTPPGSALHVEPPIVRAAHENVDDGYFRLAADLTRLAFT